ncbi:MAG: hypothetical protein ACTTKL_04745 [Treponema sp.]
MDKTMKTIDTNRRMMTGVLSAVACETLFGLSYIFTRRAVGVANPFALLAWRFIRAEGLIPRRSAS